MRTNMERRAIRGLLWLCVWPGAVLSVAGCYNAEDSWKICCGLVLVEDETSSPAARNTIIDWQKFTSFGADGSAVDSNNTNLPGSWKKRRLEAATAEFLADNPGARASDYFRGLGMACRPATVPKSDVTQCDIELPIWAECVSLNVFFPWGAPIPEELRKPMPAFLQVRVDVSASTFLGTATRVVPVPGGHLCQRQR
jgi:hypothetical protein